MVVWDTGGRDEEIELYGRGEKKKLVTENLNKFPRTSKK